MTPPESDPSDQLLPTTSPDALGPETDVEGRPIETGELLETSDAADTTQAVIDEAERELDRVHRRSIASVLRRATAVVVTRAPYYGVLASFPLSPQPVKPWRRLAKQSLRVAVSDDDRPQGSDLVARLIDRPVARWPRASRIASAARQVEDSEFARIAQGCALLCEGEAPRATRIFQGLLRRPEVLQHRWRVLEGLAHAHRALGHHRAALQAMEEAGEEPRCGISAMVDALHLAILVGDARVVRHAAARLDMLVDPFSPVFASAIGRLRRWSRVLGRGESRVDREVETLTGELARERRSPAGRVARAML